MEKRNTERGEQFFHAATGGVRLRYRKCVRKRRRNRIDIEVVAKKREEGRPTGRNGLGRIGEIKTHRS